MHARTQTGPMTSHHTRRSAHAQSQQGMGTEPALASAVVHTSVYRYVSRHHTTDPTGRVVTTGDAATPVSFPRLGFVPSAVVLTRAHAVAEP